MKDTERMEMADIVQAAMEKQAMRGKRKAKKPRYMKKVVDRIFLAAFLLTLIYLYFYWRFQSTPDALIVATYGWLGVEAISLAKIKWEEIKTVREDEEHEQD